MTATLSYKLKAVKANIVCSNDIIIVQLLVKGKWLYFEFNHSLRVPIDLFNF